MKKVLKIILSIVLILILVVGIGLTYLVGAAGGGGPFDFVWKNKLKKMPGNAEKYSLENIEPLENSPLEGKRICYLGSSVTLGLYSMDVSFADYISYRNGCEYVKEAVSGTTLVDNGKTSYIQRMKNNSAFPFFRRACLKKGLLQDVRHNLWEILSGGGRRSGLRQPNSGKIYRKVGRADCGNDFSDTL